HDVFYYYHVEQLQAVRSGKWKLHLPRKSSRNVPQTPGIERRPTLFDLENDLAETTDVAADHADVVRRLLALAEMARADLGDMKRPGKNQRPALWVDDPKPLVK
ncbi:MAG: arylsulfatase, partial [Planctomycetes bacterium]|nr:arylsulfatase [Planctomycetota bacterium]